MRLFVAADLSGSHLDLLREKVEEARLAAPFEFIRWIPEENWHGTLAFIGDRPDASSVEEAVDACASRVSALEAMPGRIQGFPQREHPRLLALKLEASSEIAALAWNLAQALGLREERKFRLHVTVARFREPTEEQVTELVRCLRGLTTIEGGPWQLPSISLYESTLKQSGASYRTLKTWII